MSCIVCDVQTLCPLLTPFSDASTPQLEAKSKSDALMLAQRTQETYEELLHKPPRIDPDAEGGVVVDDPTRKLPELTGAYRLECVKLGLVL